jgi:hypothetical protein
VRYIGCQNARELVNIDETEYIPSIQMAAPPDGLLGDEKLGQDLIHTANGAPCPWGC